MLRNCYYNWSHHIQVVTPHTNYCTTFNWYMCAVSVSTYLFDAFVTNCFLIFVSLFCFFFVWNRMAPLKRWFFLKFLFVRLIVDSIIFRAWVSFRFLSFDFFSFRLLHVYDYLPYLRLVDCRCYSLFLGQYSQRLSSKLSSFFWWIVANSFRWSSLSFSADTCVEKLFWCGGHLVSPPTSTLISILEQFRADCCRLGFLRRIIISV